MKREGRQHGVVPSYPVRPTPLPHQRRHVTTVDSASLSGLFTKVSKKPTTQSKYTGKCGAARGLVSSIHSVYKSKDKAKGSNDRQLIIGCPTGTSAIDALAYLARDEGCEDEDEDDGCY